MNMPSFHTIAVLIAILSLRIIVHLRDTLEDLIKKNQNLTIALVL